MRASQRQAILSTSACVRPIANAPQRVPKACGLRSAWSTVGRWAPKGADFGLTLTIFKSGPEAGLTPNASLLPQVVHTHVRNGLCTCT